MFGYELELFLEIPAKFCGPQAGCKMAEAFRPSYRWGKKHSVRTVPHFLVCGS